MDARSGDGVVDGDDVSRKRRRVDQGSGDGVINADDAAVRAAADQDGKEADARDEGRIERIKLLMVKVGDKVIKFDRMDKLKSQLLGLKGVLTGDVEEYSDIIVSSIVACGCCFGEKSAVYGSLVALLPVSIQRAVVQGARDKLVSCFGDDTEFPTERMITLRFICEMVNAKVVSEESIMELLGFILKKGYRELVAHCLPWLHIARQGEWRTSTGWYDDLEKSAPSEWETVKVLLDGSDENADRLIPKPYLEESIQAAYVRNSSGDDEFETISLRDDDIPPFKSANSCVRGYLELYVKAGDIYLKNKDRHKLASEKLGLEQMEDKSGLEIARDQVTLLTSAEKWLLREYVKEIVDGYNPFLTEAASALFELGDDIRYNYFIFEMMIWLLLSDSKRQVYIQTLLMKLCGEYPGRTRHVIEDTMDAVMILVPSLSSRDLDVFADWFTIHLSTFGVKIGWERWDHVVGSKQIASERQTDPRCCFLKQCFERLVTLCFREFLESILPPHMKEHVFPPPPDPVAVESEDLDKVVKQLKTKPSPEEFDEWVSANVTGLDDTQKSVLLLNSALTVGIPSLTHTWKSIERSRDALEKCMKSESGPSEAIKTVFLFWQNSPQRLGFVLLDLTRNKLILPEAVTKHFVEKPDLLQKWWAYPILSSLIEACPDTVKPIIESKRAEPDLDANTKLRLEALF